MLRRQPSPIAPNTDFGSLAPHFNEPVKKTQTSKVNREAFASLCPKDSQWRTRGQVDR
jgi:hypothetical protein